MTVRQVVEGMGLHVRKRLRKEGVVVCLSPGDRRRPVIPKIFLGNTLFRVTNTTTGVFGFSNHLEKVR